MARRKEIKEDKYLHNKIVENYKNKVEMPVLEQRKAHLSELRNFYKPVRKEDIDEFEKEYMERKRLKTDRLRIEREKYYSDLGQGNYDATKFKTKFSHRYEEEEKLKKQEEQK